MDQYSSTGRVVTEAKNMDYLIKMNEFADIAQKEIAIFRKINAVYSFSRNPIANLIPNGFDMAQHLSTDLTVEGASAKSYYFEVDGQGTVYVEEETTTDTWTTLSTITIPSTVTSFTAYSGLITASDTDNSIRLRFSGTYPYSVRNRALYAYTFAASTDVPVFAPYVKYTMPTNYRELKQIVQGTDSIQFIPNATLNRLRIPSIRQRYQGLNDYRWEGKNKLLVRYDYTGSFDVHYWANPVTISAATVDDVSVYDDTDFELDAEAQELIPFYMASLCLMKEDEGAGVTLMNIYQGKLANLEPSENEHIPQVQNQMGW